MVLTSPPQQSKSDFCMPVEWSNDDHFVISSIVFDWIALILHSDEFYSDTSGGTSKVLS